MGSRSGGSQEGGDVLGVLVDRWLGGEGELDDRDDYRRDAARGCPNPRPSKRPRGHAWR